MLYTPTDIPTTVSVPLLMCPVCAGFPLPSENYVEDNLDFNKLLIRRLVSTYCLRVAGDCMRDAGLFDRDFLVVDKSIQPKNGNIVVAAVDGEMTVKRLVKNRGRILLQPENPDYKAIDVTYNDSFEVWAVATYGIHKLL